MESLVALLSEDRRPDFQGFKTPIMGDTMVVTENYIPNFEEQLADIDEGFTRFEDRNGREDGLGPEISPIIFPQQLGVVGSLWLGSTLNQVELHMHNGSCLSKSGKVRVMRTQLEFLSDAREVNSVCLPKEMKVTMLAKRTRREFDGEIKDTVGGKKRRGSENMDLMVEVGSQPHRHH